MERLINTRVVVTGGAGFIGSHLVRSLIRQKAHVWIFDNNYYQISYTSFAEALKPASRVMVDIRNRSSVSREMNKIRPHFVYHLAAEAIVTNSFKNPYRTFQTNIMGTINVLEAIRPLTEVKGIIVASSDKAYGKTKTVYKEESPLKGDHPYDVSKSSADLVSQTYAVSYHMPIVITRFGNVYGEGDGHFDRLIPGLCKAITNDELFEIRSNGLFIRDYIYVNDVVAGYLLLLRRLKRTRGEAYNFSSSETLSVLELIAKFERILKHKIPFKILKNEQNEIPYQHLDDTKIKKLGWKQKYTLDQTLISIYKWYRNALKKEHTS